MAGRRLRVTLASHEALDQYMRFRDTSNAQLASKVGVSTATIAHLRRPRGRKTCDPALAPKIERALNAPPGSLFLAEVIDDYSGDNRNGSPVIARKTA